jgi:hypothetical protein
MYKIIKSEILDTVIFDDVNIIQKLICLIFRIKIPHHYLLAIKIHTNIDAMPLGTNIIIEECLYKVMYNAYDGDKGFSVIKNLGKLTTIPNIEGRLFNKVYE